MPAPYLSRDVLKGFDKYKYSSLDTSPFSNYVMHPFWNSIVPMLPKWLAPNFMTLFGFCLLVVNFFVLTYYDRDFNASTKEPGTGPPVPNWVWALCAVNNFLAHTLDGCDGKQARRTGSSSALGELFDHGLDSWATLFLPIGMYHIFGSGSDYGLPQFRMFLVLINVMFVFVASHWEKYNTGILYLPWGYDIAQVFMTLTFIATYLGTYEIWRTEVPLFDVSVARFFEVLMHAQSFLFTLPMCFWNIYKSSCEGKSKQPSMWEGARPLVPVVLLFAATLVWAVYSPHAVLYTHTRLFYCMTGTIFSNITCRLIVSQMSNTHCELLNWLLLPLVVSLTLLFTMNLSSTTEVAMLWMLTALATCAHLHYGYYVVQEMADHLKIYVFSVKKRQHN